MKKLDMKNRIVTLKGKKKALHRDLSLICTEKSITILHLNTLFILQHADARRGADCKWQTMDRIRLSNKKRT